MARAPEHGQLAITVVGGTCAIGIDGQDFGQQSAFSRFVPYGEHEVLCTTLNGARHARRVAVHDKTPVAVVFNLSGARAPIDPKPPVGRPTL